MKLEFSQPVMKTVSSYPSPRFDCISAVIEFSFSSTLTWPLPVPHSGVVEYTHPDKNISRNIEIPIRALSRAIIHLEHDKFIKPVIDLERLLRIEIKARRERFELPCPRDSGFQVHRNTRLCDLRLFNL